MNDKAMLYFIHILECINKIEDYTVAGKVVFLKSALIQDAVYRNLEVIGEAASKIDEKTRQSFPEVPWRKIVGMRNVLIHQYEGIAPEVTWLAVSNELPKLKASLQKIVPAKLRN